MVIETTWSHDDGCSSVEDYLGRTHMAENTR